MLDVFLAHLPELIGTVIAIGVAVMRTTDSAFAKRLAKLAQDNRGEIVEFADELTSVIASNSDAQKEAQKARKEAQQANRRAQAAEEDAQAARDKAENKE